MKKEYTNPELDLFRFESEDILTNSLAFVLFVQDEDLDGTPDDQQ